MENDQQAERQDLMIRKQDFAYIESTLKTAIREFVILNVFSLKTYEN